MKYIDLQEVIRIMMKIRLSLPLLPHHNFFIRESVGFFCLLSVAAIYIAMSHKSTIIYNVR